MLQLVCTLEVMGTRAMHSLRRRRDDRGQTAAEYLGIIVVVAIIIAAIAQTDLGAAIATGISDQIKKITDNK